MTLYNLQRHSNSCTAETRSDDGHLYLFLHTRIDHRADDHRGFFRGKLLNGLTDLGEFTQRQVKAGSDINQNTPRSSQVDIV